MGSEKEDGTRAFVMRPYTPVSAPDAKHLDLAVKIYPDGKLTPHLATMKPGDVLDFKGPIVKLPVAQAAQKKAIGLIAGGTGITPMLQLAEELLRQRYANPIKLIYANVSPADIMMKDRVDALAASHPNFSVHYIVDKAPPAKASWTGGVGYVTAEMLKEHMPGPSEDVLLCVCGPPGMMNIVSGSKVSPKDQGPLIGYLKDLGYSETNVIKF